ncbi:beta-microseminoprotein-like [Protopterus annectens]|uniref:beta-microseminoprotein-like n=1 Tax=Protopterus annectens TaxID=7888 RepID=UPI001CFB9C35|nr:beta-microseminoprotein-like [Protopterus annectens]
MRIDLKHEYPSECKDIYDKTIHPLNSQWRNSQCLDCFCKKEFIKCCTRPTPVSYPTECEKVFDQKTCEYTVVRKDDPSVSCPVYGASGK